MGAGPDQDAADVQRLDESSRAGEVLRDAGRGAVGAMAMTGMRVVTTELGLLEETPPDAVSRQRAGLGSRPRRAHAQPFSAVAGGRYGPIGGRARRRWA